MVHDGGHVLPVLGLHIHSAQNLPVPWRREWSGSETWLALYGDVDAFVWVGLHCRHVKEESDTTFPPYRSSMMMPFDFHASRLTFCDTRARSSLSLMRTQSTKTSNATQGVAYQNDAEKVFYNVVSMIVLIYLARTNRRTFSQLRKLHLFAWFFGSAKFVL